jgi:iron complex outermembrane receptor protein/hemoglobin/transferrin/lactoferrin receptor protein
VLLRGVIAHAQDSDGEVVVRGPPRAAEEARGRSAALVTREEREEQLGRSTPDALRYVPGVWVQQTGHGQASPYVRGLTGQQVLLMFDGIRLNNGLFRQGPNQYLFTVDPNTLDRLEVVRGSASVRYGSDALGGAILATPMEPRLDLASRGWSFRPRVTLRAASADGGLGARGEAELRAGPRVAVVVGGGYRDVGLLESAGPIRDLARGMRPAVPFYEPDGVTQRGTGFREATFDVRAVVQITERLRAVAALYGYRQYDAPRTDQCPPPLAPERECLWFEEQFRTLAYAALRGDAGPFRAMDLNVSYQRGHERRRRDRPQSFVENGFVDGIDTLGASFSAETQRVRFGGERFSLGVRYGAEAWHDRVASQAWTTFTDVRITRALSRGQYVDGARYLLLGGFAEADLAAWRWLRVRAGARLAHSAADVPADVESRSAAIDRGFTQPVGRVGLELIPATGFSLLANVDQGFRAPNLDDLTSRQQAGPGFQFENPDLRPERSTTWELGARLRRPRIEAEAWAYATQIDDAITRAIRMASECPPMTPSCANAFSRFRLVNAPGTTWVFGAEAVVRVHLLDALLLSLTWAWAWGEGPDPSGGSGRVPVSRIPPMNGTAEVRWRHARSGIYLGAGMRWALEQTRLAPSDLGDARIPLGGTPGYAVADLRMGWRYRNRVTVSAVIENLANTSYRVHGSSIDGPGRGIMMLISGGL